MTNRKALSLAFVTLILAAVCLLGPARPFAQEDQFRRAAVVPENYQMITDTDLYCSFYMLEEGKKLPEMRIIGAERMNEKILLNDADLVYLDRGEADGVEIGQLFEVVGMEQKVPPYGYVIQRRGRARVVRLEGNISVASLEKTCSPARVGDYLLPYEEKEGEIGRDKGFDWMDPNISKHGQVIFVDQDFRIAGTNQWALINMGRQQCLQIGDQLTVFHRAKPTLPREAVASLIVIDVRGATSTVKVLSCRDTVEVGNEVQVSTIR
jgi:hypothetical protein